MENENEIWKDIVGYEGMYQVSNLGRIKSLDRLFYSVKNKGYSKSRGRVLSLYSKKGRYSSVSLNNQGVGTTMLVHRLVAQSFVLNSNKKKFVNHKDGDKLNNHYANLEWVTHQENINHAWANNLCKKRGQTKMAKLVINTINGVFYDCVMDAHEAYGRVGYDYFKEMLNGRKINRTPYEHA